MQTPGKAFYNGLMGGGLLGLVIGFLVSLLILVPNANNIPATVWLAFFAGFGLAITIIAYDAHKVVQR